MGSKVEVSRGKWRELTAEELQSKVRQLVRDLMRGSAKIGGMEKGSSEYKAERDLELALKARYCTRHGWADFPDDRAEFRRRGARELQTHDLQKLLGLGAGMELTPGTLAHINWSRALQWEVEQRYTPTGTVIVAEAEGQINDTQKLVDTMLLYELVERLPAIETEISSVNGPFNCFA